MTDSFSDLLNAMTTAAPSRHEVEIPASWAQGQTTYGGLTAALALEATHRTFQDLPPLRTAQVTFIGAAGGKVSIEPELIRQGRTMAYIQTDLKAEKGLATRALFGFGQGRDSLFDEYHLSPPDLPKPEDCGPFVRGPMAPTFTHHFESRLAKGAIPMSGSQEHDHFIWVRFKEDIQTSLVSLLALADMPPPAMMPKFTTFKPISSLTWMVNFLVANPQPVEGGWWLLQSCAEHASQGYSSQNMLVWGADRKPVIAGRQSIAIYL